MIKGFSWVMIGDPKPRPRGILNRFAEAWVAWHGVKWTLDRAIYSVSYEDDDQTIKTRLLKLHVTLDDCEIDVIVTLLLFWDNNLGFFSCKIQVTTRYISILRHVRIRGSFVSLSHPFFLTWSLHFWWPCVKQNGTTTQLKNQWEILGSGGHGSQTWSLHQNKQVLS